MINDYTFFNLVAIIGNRNLPQFVTCQKLLCTLWLILCVPCV
jgi:hypothetical protein